LLAACATLLASEASAQTIIKNPGQHPKYSVELEPHGILWFNNAVHTYWDNSTGWGLGFRASIPLVDNGFVPTINNNVAIGFGLDWGHYSNKCWSPWYRNDPYYRGDCSSNTLWAPVVMQWNFFISKIFSAFAEPGLAIRHTWWKWADGWCGDPKNPYRCSLSDSDTGVEPVGFIGGRVGGEKVTFTFRVGYPYLTLGGSFFL
jgi:hypothetical protein